MKAKKTVAIGMAALMMSGVFAGCGSGQEMTLTAVMCH